MARVNDTSATADIRGRLGGTVLSSNAQGTYLKSFVPPVQVRTPARQEQRRLFSVFSKLWQTLSTPDREAWNDCAAAPGYERYDWWGNPYTLTGQQLYLSTALLLYRAGAGEPSGPPLSQIPPPAPAVQSVLWYSLAPNSSTLALSPPWPVGVQYVMLDVNYRIPRAALAPSGPFQPFYTFVAPEVGPVNHLALLEALFGNIPVLANVFAQVYSMTADGRCSLPAAYHWQALYG